MIYSNPQPIVTPDVPGAVFDFVKEYGLPTFSEANIFRGYQNTPLPKNSNEMCIYAVSATMRKGTNNKVKVDADLQRITQLYTIATVQVDFYSQGYEASDRAQLFTLLCRDNIGIAFFAPYNIALLQCTDPQNRSYMDESGKYVQRFGFDMQLGYWANHEITVESFEKVAVTRLENVDAGR